MIFPRFYCVDQKGQETDLFETREKAEEAACVLEMAPFTVFELRPYPVGMRHTNATGDNRFKVNLNDPGGQSSSAA